MNNIWSKLKIKISNLLNSSEQKKTNDERDYVSILIENLREIQEENKEIDFTIKSVKNKGFIVKVGGLFGYIPFRKMPWKYKNFDYWNVIGKYLIDKSFSCTIFSIVENNNYRASIKINAEKHQLKKGFKLIPEKEHKGIAVHKSKLGLIIDIGYHFNWEYGSLLGLVTKAELKDFIDIEKIEIGEVIKTFYHGYGKRKFLILGNLKLKSQKEWQTGILKKYIGTVQKATVKVNLNSQKSFYIEDKYRTSIIVNKSIYPNSNTLNEIKNVIKNLENGDIIDCKITNISKKNRFVAKIIIDTKLQKVELKETEEKIIYEEEEEKVYGYANTEKIVANENPIITKWEKEELDKLIGTIQKIKIKINEQGNRFFIFEDTYSVQLPINKSYYPNKNRLKIKTLLDLIKNGETITCEIIYVDYKKKVITARWIVNVEPSTNKKIIIPKQSNRKKYKNRLDLLVNSEIEVRVFKKDKSLGILRNRYIIMSNIEAKLKIKSYSYELSERDIGIIETNLQNGSLIKCIVSKVGREIEVEYYIDKEKTYGNSV